MDGWMNEWMNERISTLITHKVCVVLAISPRVSPVQLSWHNTWNTRFSSLPSATGVPYLHWQFGGHRLISTKVHHHAFITHGKCDLYCTISDKDWRKRLTGEKFWKQSPLIEKCNFTRMLAYIFSKYKPTTRKMTPM